MNVKEKGDLKKLKEFKIDCFKCSGLCCTALFFSKIDGFPENKVAGKPCSSLKNDYSCSIHKDLEKRNMKGCMGYDCFGAGQFVTEKVYKGESWRTLKNKSEEFFNTFTIAFQFYQVSYYLEEARIIAVAKEFHEDIDKLIKENEFFYDSNPEDIIAFDIEKYREKANVILKRVSKSVVENFKNNNKAINSFFGKSFKNKNMNGLDLSMQLLIAANFEGCTFKGTIFLGADTRDCNFSNADLSEGVFLTQGQINSAKGNRNTKLPKHLDYPVSWR
ncbi:MAG: pentapeptide repeat-containing protein [Sarcina sp.]